MKNLEHVENRLTAFPNWSTFIKELCISSEERQLRELRYNYTKEIQNQLKNRIKMVVSNFSQSQEVDITLQIGKNIPLKIILKICEELTVLGHVQFQVQKQGNGCLYIEPIPLSNFDPLVHSYPQSMTIHVDVNTIVLDTESDIQVMKPKKLKPNKSKMELCQEWCKDLSMDRYNFYLLDLTNKTYYDYSINHKNGFYGPAEILNSNFNGGNTIRSLDDMRYALVSGAKSDLIYDENNIAIYVNYVNVLTRKDKQELAESLIKYIN